jgi:hypothetical protein
MNTAPVLVPEPGFLSGPQAKDLLRMLLLREWRTPRLWILLLGGIVVAGAAGWSAVLLGESDARPDARWYATVNMARSFGPYAATFLAVLGALACIDRVVDDHGEGWLVQLVALSDSRGRYALFVYFSTLSVLLAAYACLVVGFSLPVALSGEPFARQGLRWVVGGGASIVSASAFGLALGLLVKSRAGAVITGIVLFSIPFLISLVQVLRTGDVPPVWIHRLLFLHLPPLSLSVTGTVLLQHGAYAALVIMLLLAASDRLVGRYR